MIKEQNKLQYSYIVNYYNIAHNIMFKVKFIKNYSFLKKKKIKIKNNNNETEKTLIEILMKKTENTI